MSMFANLKTEGLEESQDRLGGYAPWETDIYSGTIKMMYAGESAKGAKSVTVVFEAGGREYRETVYVTNQKGENFFPNKDDPKKKVPLPGFTTIDDICLCASGAPLCDQDIQEKMVKLWDPEEKKELPKSVPVLVDLIGKPVSLAISKVLENKNKKNDSTGEYEPTAEERNINVIEKVFHTESKMTATEARNGKTEGEFWTAWVERNKGQTRDKRKIKDGSAGQAGRPTPRTQGGPPQASAGAPARKSLFGGK